MRLNINLIRLIKARKEKGLTQAQLGQKIGKSSWAVVRLESGKRHPDEIELERIAAALNVPSSYLLGLSDLAGVVNPSEIVDGPVFSNNNPLVDSVAILDIARELFNHNHVVPVISRVYVENTKGKFPPLNQLLSLAPRRVLVDKSCFTKYSVVAAPFALKLDFDIIDASEPRLSAFHKDDLLIFNPEENVLSWAQKGYSPLVLLLTAGTIFVCRLENSDTEHSVYRVLGRGKDAPNVTTINLESSDSCVLGVCVASICSAKNKIISAAN